MRFELFVAARYLKAKRRQAVVGVVTAISVAGVAAGVAALIIALAITNGMRRDLQDRLVDSSAHVQLMRVKDDGIRDWQPLLERLRQASARRCRRARTRRAGPRRPRRARRLCADRRHPPRARKKRQQGPRPAHSPEAVNALEPQQNRAASPGSARSPPRPRQGSRRLHRRHRRRLRNPDQPARRDLTPLGMVPNIVHFRLAGTYHTGFYQYDSAWGFMRLADAQRLYDEPDLVSVISFKVDDLNNAPQIAKQIEQAAGTGFHDHQLDGAESRTVPRPGARTDRHLHRHRPHRDRRRAQHPHRAHHDGDGEDPRHRRPHELRRRLPHRCAASSFCKAC